jgi:hypothetical protein
MLRTLALLLLAGCPSDPWDPEATICGRVVLEDSGCGETPLPETVGVYTVVGDETVCSDGGWDTGGAGSEWRLEQVDEPVVDEDGWFWSDVGPGAYGVLAYSGPCEGCEGVTVEEGAECVEVDLVLSNPPEVDAPNVYLYPQVPTRVRVRMPGLGDAISASDPPYPGGWDVLALPDGRLRTPFGARDYLFYELGRYSAFQREEGWCTDGLLAVDDMAAALEAMGFLPNEVADFVDFWDAAWTTRFPVTIYPQIDDLPPLRIDPLPDDLARAWFVVAAGCDEAAVEPALPVFSRGGYHAAEWGLAVLPPLPGANVILVP